MHFVKVTLFWKPLIYFFHATQKCSKVCCNTTFTSWWFCRCESGIFTEYQNRYKFISQMLKKARQRRCKYLNGDLLWGSTTSGCFWSIIIVTSRFECFAKDKFCHNRLSLSYLKSFMNSLTISAVILTGIHIQRRPSPAVRLWVSLTFMQVCIAVWRWLLLTCVWLVCVGVLMVPNGAPEAPAKRKTAWKEKTVFFFFGFHVALGAEWRAASVERHGGGLGPGSGLWRLKGLMLSTANANDFGKKERVFHNSKMRLFWFPAPSRWDIPHIRVPILRQRTLCTLQ